MGTLARIGSGAGIEVVRTYGFDIRSAASNRRYIKRVLKTIGILKWNALPRAHRLSVVDEAIIVTNSPKNTWINQPGRAEPSATEVNIWYQATSREAYILDLNRVGWYTIWKWRRWTLKHIYVCLGASLTHSIHWPIFLLCIHACTHVYIINFNQVLIRLQY